MTSSSLGILVSPFHAAMLIYIAFFIHRHHHPAVSHLALPHWVHSPLEPELPCVYNNSWYNPLSETKLDKDMLSSEFTPASYKVFHQGRHWHGGGVMMVLRDSLATEEVEISDCLGEPVWVKIQLKGNHFLYLSSVYRTPSDNTDRIDQFAKSVEHIDSLSKNDPGSTVFVGGDFSSGGIDWTNLGAPVGLNHKNICQRLLDTLGQFFLTQMNQEPTGESAILYLFLTNKPGLVKPCTVIPGFCFNRLWCQSSCSWEATENKTHVGKADLDKFRNCL